VFRYIGVSDTLQFLIFIVLLDKHLGSPSAQIIGIHLFFKLNDVPLIVTLRPVYCSILNQLQFSMCNLDRRSIVVHMYTLLQSLSRVAILANASHITV